MSYALAGALQAAVFAALDGDAELAGLVGGVFDAIPDGAPDLYVALGPERVTAIPDTSGQGAAHMFRISVVTTREGYSAAKEAGGRVCQVLEGKVLPMAQGRVIDLHFKQGDAKRDRREGTRRVDLEFRARTEL